MSRKIGLCLVLLWLVVSCCHCQLNFSTGWGKRGLAPPGGVPGSAPGSSQSPGAPPCKASVDSLMVIYKLIQNEAQKMLDCDKFSY